MSSPKNSILLGDIGGTKARFALLGPQSKVLSEIRIYQSRNFSSFEDLLKAYFEDIQGEIKPKYALFALAGPVIKNKATITNLHWTIKSEEVKKKFAFEKVYLLNDLQALSASLSCLRESDILTLKKVRPIKRYPKVFMALGTGLGISLLVSTKPLLMLPSEGGHTPFGALDAEEKGFIEYLKERDREITWEEALSGRGLTHWYEYLYHERLDPEEITALAKEGDLKAKRVIEKIFQLLGRKCYEVAVTFEPFGGIYLAGGVILALATFWPEMSNSFFKGYNYSSRLQALIEAIPLHIVLHPYPGLLGAQTIAHTLLK